MQKLLKKIFFNISNFNFNSDVLNGTKSFQFFENLSYIHPMTSGHFFVSQRTFPDQSICQFVLFCAPPPRPASRAEAMAMKIKQTMALATKNWSICPPLKRIQYPYPNLWPNVLAKPCCDATARHRTFGASKKFFYGLIK